MENRKRETLENHMDPIESEELGWKKVESRKQKRANKVAVCVENESNGADAARSKRQSNCNGDEIAARDEKKVVSRKQKSVDLAANIVAVYVEDESNGAGAARSKRRSTCYGEDSDDDIATSDEKKVVQKSADRAANIVAVYVDDESNGAGAARSKRRSTCYREEGDDEIVARDENLEAEETKKLKPNKEMRQVSLAEAAAKISPSSLETYLDKVSEKYFLQWGVQLLRFVDFFGRELSDVQFSLPEMLKNPSLFKLNDVYDVPLSHFPDSVCKTSSDWINRRRLSALRDFVLWAFDQILAFLAAEQGGGPPHTCPNSQVSIFVSLAMVLRSYPNAFTNVLEPLRQSRYRRQDKLPLMVWMMAQASQGDLAVGLYSWGHNLLPLAGSNPQTRDLILQLVDKILSYPNAPDILVNKAISNGKPLIPPPSFEILLRLTFPAPSARVKATERFEAIYPVLKGAALACSPGSWVMKEVTQQIFTFSLKLVAQQGSPPLAKEATEIAIWCLTENVVDCCNHWGNLYMQNVEASAALLKNLVDEWKDHCLKLSSSNRSSSKRDTFTSLIRTMQSFRLKNEKAITEGGANGCLYKEADESCKVILGRLGRGSSCLKGTASPRLSRISGWLKGTASPRLSLGSGWLKGTAITAVVLAAAGVLSFNLEATTHLICTYSSMQPPQL